MIEVLQIKLSEEAKEFYKENSEQIERMDSGYDLFYCGEDISIQSFERKKISFGISCQIKDFSYIHHIGTGIAVKYMSESTLEPHGYDLLPRSSISKTPLMLCNSVGIIDAGYRGPISAVVINMSHEPFVLKRGERLFQICMPNRQPFKVEFVEELTETIRGTGGFGSTNVSK